MRTPKSLQLIIYLQYKDDQNSSVFFCQKKMLWCWKKEASYCSLKWATDLHQPVQENCPHLGLQMRMVLHHVDIPGVSLILLQHVVPYHILTGPAGKKTEMDTMVTLHCPLVQHESMISLDIYMKHKINRKCWVNASIWFLHCFTGVYSSFK